MVPIEITAFGLLAVCVIVLAIVLALQLWLPRPAPAPARGLMLLVLVVVVIVGLILVYAVPTIINPQWTSSITALFRTAPLPDDRSSRDPGTIFLRNFFTEKPLLPGSGAAGPGRPALPPLYKGWLVPPPLICITKIPETKKKERGRERGEALPDFRAGDCR